MDGWMVDYWIKSGTDHNKKLSLEIGFYIFCYIYSELRVEIPWGCFYLNPSILFPLLHNLFGKYQFTIKT